MKINFPDISQITNITDLVRYSSIIFKSLKQILTNGVSFSDQIDCQTISVTFSSANTQVSISHNLGRTPIGYFPVYLSSSMVIYNTSQFSNNQIFLISSAAGKAQLVVY